MNTDTDTEADAASGVHPEHTSLVPDWDPYVARAGNAFDALFLELKPECERLMALYENRRSALIPMAHLFQEHEGWLSPNAVAAIAWHIGVSHAVVESTVSFYTLLYRRPIGRYMLQVCRGLACSINGAEDVMAYFRQQLGVEHLETTADGLFSYEEVECLAACDRPTCMQVNLRFRYDVTKEGVDAMLAAMRSGAFDVAPKPQTVRPGRTWKIAQDSPDKSAGAQGVSNPNNAGGVGDRSGVIMLDRVVTDPSFSARSNERLVREKNLRPSSDGGHH